MKSTVIADVYDANYAVSLEQRGNNKVLIVRRNEGGCWYDRECYAASATLARELTDGMTCAAPTIAALISAAAGQR